MPLSTTDFLPRLTREALVEPWAKQLVDRLNRRLLDISEEVNNLTLSGSGTVTSVAGGHGLTGTPDPIVTTGTLDLDINSLTSETVLQTGDLFPFLDVSVGTGPSSQRKVTIDNVKVGLESLGINATTLDGIDSTGFSLVAHTHSASSITSPAALTRLNDTNVTLTLTGSPSVALLAAAQLELGWTGALSIGRGGTGQTAATAAFNALSPLTTEGDLLTRDASNNVRLGVGTNTQILQSNGGQPTWQTVSSDIALAFGGAATIQDNVVSNAKLRDSGACSIIGRSANSLGDPADISAATNGHFLRRASDVVGFGAITTADLPLIDHGSGLVAASLLDDDHTIYLLLAGRTGSTNDPILSTSTGGILSGSSASGQDLSLQSTTHATKGLINLRDKARLFTEMPAALTGDNVVLGLNETSDIGGAQLRLLQFLGTYTVDAIATIVYGFEASPTFDHTASAAFSTFTLFRGAPTLTGSTATVPPMSPGIFEASPTLRATDNDIGTTAAAMMYMARPTISALTNADSKLVVTTVTGYEWFLTQNANIAGATSEVTTARGFHGRSASLTGVGTKTLNNHFVVDIENQGTAGSTVAGLRNADRSVFIPSTAQVIDAAGDTILANATVVMVSNTTGASITLTSAPTIANGQDGQLLIVISTGTQNVVIQDQGTLASSNLRLSAATVTLAPRDNIILVYSSTVGDWVQIGQTNVV